MHDVLDTVSEMGRIGCTLTHAVIRVLCDLAVFVIVV
jgi:hypothetical protein